MAQSGSTVFVEWVRYLGILVAILGAIALMRTSVEPVDVLAADCEESLQSLVDAAVPEDTVEVPGGCVYREKVTVDKPLTLKADSGAEIRGSDVWSTGWTKSGSYWVSKDTLPSFYAHGECKTGTSRCLWPEQVFFDGEPLSQVTSDPEPGQFAVDANRNIVFADKPSGHTVEVTTRAGWLVVRSDDVTVQGFKMKHAANDSQSGAVNNGGYSRLTVEDNVLSDAHGAVVSLAEGKDLRLLRNDISNGGQLGVHGSTADVLVRGNTIHHNNTESFDPGWEAGGMKTTLMRSLMADGNEVYANDGPGLWCDIDCAEVVYSNNRVHHNTGPGVFFEISSGARIFGNVVWENGWGFTAWGWGAGILSSSSRDAEINGNTVAWNADGISVISQDRGEERWKTVKNIHVYDNVILTEDRPEDEYHNLLLAWLQDWTGEMFKPSTDNRGANNRYWHPSPESSASRFAWDGYKSRLVDFDATPGEQGGRYMSEEEKDREISDAGIPASPEPR